YMTILSHWPTDPLRPNLSFPDFVRRHVEQQFTQPKIDEAYEKRQLNALSSLLEDRYKKMYPATDHVLMPKSQPDYYRKLLEELEAAPKRSWLERQLNSWKGWIRMK
ncbi:hypothetical protein L873DRAFT_1661911, partial [Choiromyces venosus 120613-1]